MHTYVSKKVLAEELNETSIKTRADGSKMTRQVLKFSKELGSIEPAMLNWTHEGSSTCRFLSDRVIIDTKGEPLNLYEVAVKICESYGWTLVGFKPSDYPPRLITIPQDEPEILAHNEPGSTSIG